MFLCKYTCVLINLLMSFEILKYFLNFYIKPCLLNEKISNVIPNMRLQIPKLKNSHNYK